jgi:hypothetical protein
VNVDVVFVTRTSAPSSKRGCAYKAIELGTLLHLAMLQEEHIV